MGRHEPRVTPAPVLLEGVDRDVPEGLGGPSRVAEGDRRAVGEGCGDGGALGADQQLLEEIGGKGEVGKRSGVEEADALWRRTNSLRLLRAQPSVQFAMGAFDEARSALVKTVNAKDGPGMAKAYDELRAKRVGMIEAANRSLASVGELRARHLLPLHLRLARRMRPRQPAAAAHVPTDPG